MKVIVFILSLFLLVSCSPENLWQKAGVVAPKPMTISPKTGGAEEKEGKKIEEELRKEHNLI